MGPEEQGPWPGCTVPHRVLEPSERKKSWALSESCCIADSNLWTLSCVEQNSWHATLRVPGPLWERALLLFHEVQRQLKHWNALVALTGSLYLCPGPRSGLPLSLAHFVICSLPEFCCDAHRCSPIDCSYMRIINLVN